jgi:hypothetical protein
MSHQDLRITTTVTQGAIDLYASATWEQRPQYDNQQVQQIISSCFTRYHTIFVFYR